MKNLSLLSLALVCSACIAEVDYSETDSEVTVATSLTAAQYSASRSAASAIRTSALNSNSASIQALVGTSDGRAMFATIVSCALPAGQSVIANGLTYPGSLGVATGWQTAVPTQANRRWTTACVLGRTTATGLSATVSLRHDTYLPLLSSAAERSTYATTVGGFYGDIFQAAPTNFACGAVAWPAGSNPLVECARSVNGVTTNCGFSWAGLCPATSGPCTDKLAPYGTCTGSAVVYSEVSTLYIQ